MVKIEIVFNCGCTQDFDKCKFSDVFVNQIGDTDCRHLESDSYIRECKNKDAILEALSKQ